MNEPRKPPPPTACRENCGRAVANEGEATAAGWTQLPVAGGWRCGPCVRELLEVSKLRGDDGETPDLLPKDSRGALQKETASSITPPAKI